MPTLPPVVGHWALGWALCLAVALPLVAVHLRLLARQREPDPDTPGAQEKIPYARLAADRRVVLIALTGAIVGAAVAAGSGPMAPAWLVWGSGVGALIASDAVSTWIPRGLTRLVLVELGLALAASAALARSPGIVVGAAGGAAAVGAFFWLVWRVGAGLGFADVRLAVGLGALSGAGGTGTVVLAVMAAAVAGALIGLVHGLGPRRHEPFAYGPALWLGAFAVLLWPLVQ